MLFATDETFYRVGLFIGPMSNEVVRIKIRWKLFRGYHVNSFYSLLLLLPLKMWAPKYQCGRVKLHQLGAHMAPGVLKLFATLYFRRRHSKFSELVPNTFAERSCNIICSN